MIKAQQRVLRWMALGLCAGRLALAETPAPLRLVTEHLPPLSFLLDGQPAGLSVDVVQTVLSWMDQEGPIEMLPWAQGYAALCGDAPVALFATGMTAERKAQFKWAGPIARIQTAFYAKKGGGSTLTTIDSAHGLATIAVVRDDLSAQELERRQFTNLVYFATAEDAARALLAGTVAAAFLDNITLAAVVGRAGGSPRDVEQLLACNTVLLYVAFSQSVPDTTVAQWQQALDTLKQNHDFDRIYAMWLPLDTAPGVIQLVTEEYPPVTFRRDGHITGQATDVVRAMIARLGLPDNMLLLDWSDAYNLALINPGVALFTTARTPDREDLFHWIGPVGSFRDVVYARRAAAMHLDSLDDARKVRALGVVSSSFSQQMLQDAGFTNLVPVTVDGDNVRRLMDGSLDLCTITDLTAPAIVAAAGFKMEDLEPVFTLKQYDYYIALSRGTPAATVSAWQQAFADLKAGGDLDAIQQQWLPGAAKSVPGP